MKKILLSLFAVLGLLTSCDMDHLPAGTLPDEEAITDINRCRAFRNGIYGSIRSLSVGDWQYCAETQMDMFLMLQNGQGLTPYLYNAQIDPSFSLFSSAYAGPYAMIAEVNFFLDKTNDLLKKLNATERAQAERYMAEAKFARAYAYWYLFDHFCQTYSTDKENLEGLGLSIVTKYNPTGDTSTYKGRSSMKATIDFINKDLADAFEGLQKWEETDKSALVSTAPYLSSYAVMALQSRVALTTGDLETAANLSLKIYRSGIYKINKTTAYKNMWSTDAGSDLIFVPACNANEAGSIGSMCQGWNYWVNAPDQVQMIPSASTLAMYDAKDVRYEAFFIDDYDVKNAGQLYQCTVFNKFPGNTTLDSGAPAYKNKPKPFRLSEQLLILAEATWETDPTMANDALSEIRKNRITGYKHTKLSGTALRDEIRTERTKELLGEGFRMSDLRRWGLGFSRDADFTNTDIVQCLNQAGLSVNYLPGDYRYVWPIPTHEMEINPHIKDQQNPGY